MLVGIASPRLELRAAPHPVAATALVRRSEWVILAFLLYAALVSVAIPIAPVLRARTILLNLGILAVYSLLIRADSLRPRPITAVIRDWLALALILLAYREVGWLALAHTSHALELRWVAWDRAVLHGGLKAAVEAFGPVMPSILEIAYALVYTLAPFCVAVLYGSGERERVERFLLVFATAVLLCYVLLPFWPSEPPRTVFPGVDLPAYLTVFRRFNLWMLAGAGIHTGVFPSAHVAGAFGAAFGMRRAGAKYRWIHPFLFTMAVLIALAVVYGRYHYLADAVAGFSMAICALVLSFFVDRRRSSNFVCRRVAR
jgi:membrane-associated phospholipid phosphatase